MWRCCSSASPRAFAAALFALERLSLLRATQINQISGKTPRSTRFQVKKTIKQICSKKGIKLRSPSTTTPQIIACVPTVPNTWLNFQTDNMFLIFRLAIFFNLQTGNICLIFRLAIFSTSFGTPTSGHVFCPLPGNTLGSWQRTGFPQDRSNCLFNPAQV